MYVRHVSVPKEGQDMDEVIENFRKNVYGVLRECEGFQAILFFVDRGTGDTVGMTLWDTEENMTKSGEVLQAARAERLQGKLEKEGTAEKRFMEVALFETS